MPLYRFKCSNMACGKEYENIVPHTTISVECPICKGISKRLPSQTSKPSVRVKLDPYRNKSVLQNINQIMKKRSRDYQRKYELGEMVAKHGLETVQKNTTFFDQETGKVKTKLDEK